jgi:hypothetical protein
VSSIETKTADVAFAVYNGKRFGCDNPGNTSAKQVFKERQPGARRQQMFFVVSKHCTEKQLR